MTKNQSEALRRNYVTIFAHLVILNIVGCWKPIMKI